MRIFTLALAALAALAAHDAAAQWRPAKNVEIIVGTGAGGGQDKTARVLARILAERRLVEAPLSVVNKPGGGGAVGWAYLNQHAGDAHFLEVGTTTLITNQLNGRTTFGYHDVTPLATLFAESVMLAVRSESADRKSTRLNSSHVSESRMPSSA